MKTILVIEDEDSIIDLLNMLLVDEGYHVITARNGREGLMRLAESLPTLILCDVMMPVMNGLEFCQEVQSHAEYHSIPIILMSAVGQKIRSEGCPPAAFLEKPFDIDRLLDTLVAVMRSIAKQ
jgi:CheY-like chemotaxis protein